MATELNQGADPVLGKPEPSRPPGGSGHTPAWIYVIQCLLSAVFLTAAYFKLKDPNNTLTSIYQYKLLSWQASDWLACALPWMEAAAAIGLWVRRVQLGAILLGSALLGLFVIALLSALARNLDISCGCFGTGNVGTQVGPRLLEDVILLAFYLPIWRHHARFKVRRASVSATGAIQT